MTTVFELFSSPSLLAGSFYTTPSPSSSSPSSSSSAATAPFPTSSSYSSSSTLQDDTVNNFQTPNLDLELTVHDPNIDVDGLEQCYKIILQTGKVSIISFDDKFLSALSSIISISIFIFIFILVFILVFFYIYTYPYYGFIIYCCYSSCRQYFIS